MAFGLIIFLFSFGALATFENARDCLEIYKAVGYSSDSGYTFTDNTGHVDSARTGPVLFPDGGDYVLPVSDGILTSDGRKLPLNRPGFRIINAFLSDDLIVSVEQPTAFMNQKQSSGSGNVNFDKATSFGLWNMEQGRFRQQDFEGNENNFEFDGPMFVTEAREPYFALRVMNEGRQILEHTHPLEEFGPVPLTGRMMAVDHKSRTLAFTQEETLSLYSLGEGELTHLRTHTVPIRRSTTDDNSFDPTRNIEATELAIEMGFVEDMERAIELSRMGEAPFQLLFTSSGNELTVLSRTSLRTPHVRISTLDTMNGTWGEGTLIPENDYDLRSWKIGPQKDILAFALYSTEGPNEIFKLLLWSPKSQKVIGAVENIPGTPESVGMLDKKTVLISYEDGNIFKWSPEGLQHQ